MSVTRQGRIQDSEGGGGSYIQKGGFRTGISGADPNCCRVLGKSTSKKKLQTAVGGGGADHPPPPCIRAFEVSLSKADPGGGTGGTCPPFSSPNYILVQHYILLQHWCILGRP